MDSHAFHNIASQSEFFKDHIEGIRKHPWTKNAKICFFGERNVGHEIGHMQHLLANYNNTWTYKQKTDRDFGIWTDEEAKLSYAFSAQLEFAKGNVYYLENLVCANASLDISTRREDTIKEFESQAARYKLISSDPKSPHSKARLTVSGKVGKNGKLTAGFNDDLFFAFTGAVGVHDKILRRQLENVNYNFFD